MLNALTLLAPDTTKLVAAVSLEPFALTELAYIKIGQKILVNNHFFRAFI